jgi:hypothetical protein
MLSYVTWATDFPIALALGDVTARGDASAQVRDPARAAAIGDAATLVARIGAAVVQSLAEVLQGMEPSADQFASLREDLASVVQVSANRKLAAVGVSLLDLTIVELYVLHP